MSEDQRERECLGWLGELGYTHLYEPDIAHDSSDRQRASDREVALAVVNRLIADTLSPTDTWKQLEHALA